MQFLSDQTEQSRNLSWAMHPDKKRTRQGTPSSRPAQVLGPLEPNAHRIPENGKRPYSVIPSSFAAS
jgi:hypothetical protein